MDTPQTETVSTVFRERMLTIALTALIPIFTGAAYITGLAYHEAYFNVFHIPATLMPIGTADNFVYAHKTITELGWSIFKNGYVVVSIGGFIFWASFQWILMDLFAERARQNRFIVWIKQRFSGSPRVNAVGRILLIPTIIASGCLYLLVAVLVLLVVPVELGSAAGRMVAQDKLIEFSKDCQKPAGKNFCNIIMESEKQLAQGYIVGSSEKNVIVYDGKKTVLFPRGDKMKITQFIDDSTKR